MKRDIYIVSIPRTKGASRAEVSRSIRDAIYAYSPVIVPLGSKPGTVKVFVETSAETRYKLVDTLLRGRAIAMRKKRRSK